MLVVRRSLDPPSVIQLLGPVVAWAPLAIAAAAFLKSFGSVLGKRVGEAVADGVAASTLIHTQ